MNRLTLKQAKSQKPPKVAEHQFQAAVIELAEVQGWRVYHTHDSRRSQPGFPDLTMVRGQRLIFAELKREDGKETAEQTAWLTDLSRVAYERFEFVTIGPPAIEVFLWRPFRLARDRTGVEAVAMAEVPWIAFCSSDWRGGVANLSDFEELVYFKLCLAMWDAGDPVHEDDVPRLFRRDPPDLDEAIATLIRLGKIKRSETGFLTNFRAIKSHKTSLGRVRQAKRANAKRWEHKRKRDDAAALRKDVRQEAMRTSKPQPQPQPESFSLLPKSKREKKTCAGNARGRRAGGAMPALPALYCDRCGTEREGTLAWATCPTCGAPTHATEKQTQVKE